MPRFDGTGPRGEGPKTGRGMGRCGGGKTNSTGSNMGRGAGRWGRGPEPKENK